MTLAKVLSAVLAAAALTNASYQLVEEHKGHDFFQGFDFFIEADPTHGNVIYTSASEAISKQLIGVVPTNDNSSSSDLAVYMGVEHAGQTVNRASVRVTSKRSYNHALVLIDVAHMPTGCGVWPAVWMTGPNWPTNGEIDIIEQVNDKPYNTATLHTSANCAITNPKINSNGRSPLFSGKLETSDCDVNSASQLKNAGCGIRAPINDTFTSSNNESCTHSTAGPNFNAQQGGIYATLWTNSSISIYFFPRPYIPTDILSNTPNPSTWTNKPQAVFSSSACNFDASLRDLQLVINTDLCGDWAGNTWDADGCKRKTGFSTCKEFVEKRPELLGEAYWLFDSVRVFEESAMGSG